jgi:hypothetical protein
MNWVRVCYAVFKEDTGFRAYVRSQVRMSTQTLKRFFFFFKKDKKVKAR